MKKSKMLCVRFQKVKSKETHPRLTKYKKEMALRLLQTELFARDNIFYLCIFPFFLPSTCRQNWQSRTKLVMMVLCTSLSSPPLFLLLPSSLLIFSSLGQGIKQRIWRPKAVFTFLASKWWFICETLFHLYPTNELHMFLFPLMLLLTPLLIWYFKNVRTSFTYYHDLVGLCYSVRDEKSAWREKSSVIMMVECQVMLGWVFLLLPFRSLSNEINIKSQFTFL